MTHEMYMKQMLFSLNIEIKNVEILNRIAIAESKVKTEMLQRQIDSLESQLSNNKKV